MSLLGWLMNGLPTRDRILDAAREELAAHGYNGTSLRGVARRAQVDIRLLHHYFGSRSRLLRTALQPRRCVATAGEAPGPLKTPDGPLSDGLRGGTRSDAARLAQRLRALWNADALGRRALVASAMTDGPTGSRLVSFVTGLLRDLDPTAGPGHDPLDRDQLGRAVTAAHLLGLAVLCESGALHRLVAASGEAACQADEFSLESQLDAVLAAGPPQEAPAPYGDEAGKRYRRPRPPGTANRAIILRAACEELSEYGYGGSTVRGIADRAGVNTSLIHYYFGSRDGVLTAALREAGRLLVSAGDGHAAPDGRILTGEQLLRRELVWWESEERRSAILALIRSSVTHRDAGRHLAEVLRRVSPDATGPCPHTVMLGAQLIGLMVVRHITPVAPLASADLDDLIALLAPVARHVIAGQSAHPAHPPGR